MKKHSTQTNPPSEQEVKRQKRELRLSIIGIIVIIAAMVIVLSLTSKLTSQTEGQLKIEDLVIGTGLEAKSGNCLTVHYTGWLADKTKFDSSLDRNEPFEFVLGKKSVIKGWDKGLVGMKKGGKRKLIIPPQMAYGEEGSGKIPPNATLTFEIELLRVQDN